MAANVPESKNTGLKGLAKGAATIALAGLGPALFPLLAPLAPLMVARGVQTIGESVLNTPAPGASLGDHYFTGLRRQYPY